jgi:hypothetical protein
MPHSRLTNKGIRCRYDDFLERITWIPLAKELGKVAMSECLAAQKKGRLEGESRRPIKQRAARIV